jgi:cation transport ATPase
VRTRLPPASSVFLVLSLLGIVLGAVLRWGADEQDAANLVWGVTTAIGLVPIAWEVLSGIVHKQAGVDLIAVLAMVGALVLGEYLAGAVIAFMLATGRALEDFAEVRAHRELSALLERAPRSAHRYDGSSLSSVPIADVRPGDRLLVKHGEVVPVDGFLASGNGVFDESALTGESRPVERVAGEQVRSGAVNAGPAFDLRAVASADRSTYAGILRLVEQAQRERAPFVRLADRYALIFVPVALVVALPADPGGPDRDRSRHLESGQARDHRQRRWSVGGARPRTRPALRQDRHPDRGNTRGGRGLRVR